MRGAPAGNDFDGWVARLAHPSKHQEAKLHLRFSGAAALPAVRRGAQHANPRVRATCVALLDFLVDDESVGDLVAALDDPDPDVVGRALHALACDHCKQNECLPGEELWVERALEFTRDANPDLRARAIDALAKVARRRPDVAAALAESASSDPDAGIRNLARRFSRRARVPTA